MKRAFVTYIATDDYLPGVLTLNKSLKTFDNDAPLVVITTDQLSEKSKKILEVVDCRVIIVSEIVKPSIDTNSLQVFNHYTKLRIFELDEYEKIVFLDADLLICDNIESLFSALHMSSVVAGGLIEENKWVDLNGGLLVIEPSKALFKKIHISLNYLLSSDGTDQGILQAFFSNWREDKELHLDHKFNVPAAYIDTYCDKFNFDFSYKEGILYTNISVIHFWGPIKPWHVDTDSYNFIGNPLHRQSIQLWWDFYKAALNDLEKEENIN